MAVGEGAQGGLADDAGQTPDGDEEAGLGVGEAPAGEQGGLIGADGGEHGPEADLHGHIVVVQTADGGHGALPHSQSVQFVPRAGFSAAGGSRAYWGWTVSLGKKSKSSSRAVEPAVYMTMTRSGSSQSI